MFDRVVASVDRGEALDRGGAARLGDEVRHGATPAIGFAGTDNFQFQVTETDTINDGDAGIVNCATIVGGILLIMGVALVAILWLHLIAGVADRILKMPAWAGTRPTSERRVPNLDAA